MMREKRMARENTENVAPYQLPRSIAAILDHGGNEAIRAFVKEHTRK